MRRFLSLLLVTLTQADFGLEVRLHREVFKSLRPEVAQLRAEIEAQKKVLEAGDKGHSSFCGY